MRYYFINRIRNSFRSARPVPAELRGTFLHLYLDIAWFGLLSGTTLAFLAVYAARQGASPQQIGLMSAVPALSSLLFSLPAGSWLGKRPIGGAVFWTSVLARAFYLAFIPLPLLLAPHAQVWTIIFLMFVITIPNTAVTVGFTALFAEAVPIEWRGQVVGTRNALLAIITTVTSLAAGQILGRVAFPLGYQIVFTLGFLGAVMSSVQLYYLRHVCEPAARVGEPSKQLRNGAARRAVELGLLYRRGIHSLRLDVLSGSFARLMSLLFFWHFAQFLTIPTITPYVVNHLHFSDDLIGMATAIFNLTTFLGSFRLGQASMRWGNKKVTAFGIIGVSVFPMLMALTRGPALYLGAHLVGGLAWAMASGALYNYILENVPTHDRPAYLAWYSLISNAAILSGSLLGPELAGMIGFSLALFLYGVARLLAGAAIWKWG